MEKLTTENVKDFDSEVDYTTVLDNFEGPLDLLLYLINKEEIAIEDIFVSQVTEQFLTYMQGLPYLDMEKASEYLNIAATIIDIKARSLVPPLEDYFDEDDYGYEEDPKDALIRALNEYKMIKEEADKLKERETVGYFFKAPDKDIGELQVKYKDFTLDGLVDAFTKLMLKRESERASAPPPKEIPREAFTVRDRIHYIRNAFDTKDCVNFEDLFEPHAPKSEIVTTFQALLELLKHQYLTVEQNGLFAPITIRKNHEKQEDDDLGDIDEYN